MWPESPRREERRSGARLAFADDFDDPVLDRRRWSPFYLPHWSEDEPAEARYRIEEGRLVLRVDPDQAPWCPEFDGDVRVSALQTGQFSGPPGGAIGQHRFRPALAVRRHRAIERLYTPREGEIVIRARADVGPTDLVSLYLIGFEDVPDDSGEITVCEVFGRDVHEDGVAVGRGIKAVNDPRLTTEFFHDRLPIRLSDWHEYAIHWTTGGVRFFLDDEPVGASAQSPAYPMQLMLTCYRLEQAPQRAAGPRLEVDYVRGYERTDAGRAP
jgi:hypothetical protein